MNRNPALIVVDLQSDFFEDGALPVEGATGLLPKVNSVIAAAHEAGWPILFLRDWHPENHASFKAAGGPWPVHCVAHSAGARFHRDLLVPHDAMIVSKGESVEGMGYSPFENEKFEQTLKERSITRLFVVGVALEYCIKSTCIDARDRSFDVIAATNMVASVDQDAAVIERRWEELILRGVTVVRDSTEIEDTWWAEAIGHHTGARDTSSNG